jgi:putative MATE family efflux protein
MDQEPGDDGRSPADDDPSRNHILADPDVGGLLWRLSIPATVGMAVMATYNVVDTIFIGRGVGTLGIAGLAVCFPVQLIVMALGHLVGMGSASIISRALGAGDRDRVRQTLGNALTLILIAAAGIMVLGFGFLDGLLRVFGATDAILPFARSYMSTILWGTGFACYSMAHSNIIRAEGRAMVAMTRMLIGAGVNLVLDPIFIFALDMGIQGAAIATVIAQACSTLFIITYLRSGRSSLSMRPADMRLVPGIVREILAVGAASFGRMAAGSAVMIVLNRSLGHYGGNLAIAAYGVIHRILQFSFMPLMGFAQALQPVAGFNYGAKRFLVARRALRISAVRSTLFAAGAFAAFMLAARPLIGLFTRDEELIRLAVPALRTVAAVFPVLGLQMMGSALFQAFGRARPAIFLSLSRQIIFLIPLVLVLPVYMGLGGIFVAFPAADILGTVITVVMLTRELRRLEQMHVSLEAA